MPVTLRTTLPRPSRLQLTDKALMREIGLLAIETIRTRTRQGRDAEGRPFPPYSESYARRKAEEVGASGTPNLTLSGVLLNTIHIMEVTDTSVTIGWIYSNG